MAERELGGNRGLKKILNKNPITKLFGWSRGDNTPAATPTSIATTLEAKSPSYEAPRTFSTDDFFPPSEHFLHQEMERASLDDDEDEL